MTCWCVEKGGSVAESGHEGECSRQTCCARETEEKPINSWTVAQAWAGGNLSVKSAVIVDSCNWSRDALSWCGQFCTLLCLFDDFVFRHNVTNYFICLLIFTWVMHQESSLIFQKHFHFASCHDWGQQQNIDMWFLQLQHLAVWHVISIDKIEQLILRFATHRLLYIPRYALKTYGRRAFAYASPSIWNFPSRSSTFTIDYFKRLLKTFLCERMAHAVTMHYTSLLFILLCFIGMVLLSYC